MLLELANKSLTATAQALYTLLQIEMVAQVRVSLRLPVAKYWGLITGEYCFPLWDAIFLYEKESKKFRAILSSY